MNFEMDAKISIQKIVSGGQTGVDRAALDFAIENSIHHGGWCPRGRIAEDGSLDPKYHLREHVSPNYADRTRANIIDSDATLILYWGRIQGGTLLTSRYAGEVKKPLLKIRLHGKQSFNSLHEWIISHRVLVLNIAGPRESSAPGIYNATKEFLSTIGFRQGLTADESH